MGGDFRQLPPVLRRAGRADVVAQCIRNSAIWTDAVETHQLTENVRAKDDPDWQRFLLSVGDGTRSHVEQLGPDVIRLPTELIYPLGSTEDTERSVTIPSADELLSWRCH